MAHIDFNEVPRAQSHAARVAAAHPAIADGLDVPSEPESAWAAAEELARALESDLASEDEVDLAPESDLAAEDAVDLVPEPDVAAEDEDDRAPESVGRMFPLRLSPRRPLLKRVSARLSLSRAW